MREFVLNKYILFMLVFVFTTIFDQVTKIWVVNNINCNERHCSDEMLQKFNFTAEKISEIRSMPAEIEITSFFSLVHTQNAGAAFGIMQGQMFIFAIFTILAIGVITWTLVQLPDDDRFQNIALALLLSGTIGNGIDRFHKQMVTDFLHFHTEFMVSDAFPTGAWPSFNIADAAIVIGMIMFGFHYLFLEQDEDEEAEPDPPADAVSDVTL